MNEEEKELLDSLKYLYEEDKEVNRYATINYSIPMYPNKIKKTINLIEKQQKQIEILKNNLKEERAFCKSTLETLKNCVDKDYLHKMISFKDGEIEKLKEAYQVLKDDLEEHRIVYIDTPEFEEKYISKDKIKEVKAKWDKSIAWANADDYYYAMKMLDELLGE